MSEPLLQVTNLTAHYGASQILFSIDLAVPDRGVVAVLGRNGAGKTTLLRSILGYLPPTGGTVRLCGEQVTGTPPARLARRGVGYMPQEQTVFPTLTVEQNLLLGCSALPRKTSGRMQDAYDLFPKLGDRRRQQAGTLSGGERKMLSLARALLGRPQLLVLDEPTEGVWHGVVDEIIGALQAFAAQGAVLLVEQHLQLALSVAESAVVLQRGEVAMHGLVDDLREDPRLLAYLAPAASEA